MIRVNRVWHDRGWAYPGFDAKKLADGSITPDKIADDLMIRQVSDEEWCELLRKFGYAPRDAGLR